jgi:hypothetical protein
MLRWKTTGLAMCLMWLLSSGCADRNCCEPHQGNPTFTYIFRDGWAFDWPGESSKRHYWYFECTGDSVEYVGYWAPSQQPEPPPWWDEAKVAAHCFDRSGSDCDPRFGPVCSDVSKTPREDREAEEMALWLSGSVVAPEDLYDTMLAQLGRIRKQYGDTIPVLKSIVFEPTWPSSDFEVGLTDEAEARYAAGQYHDLDLLNAHFGLKWQWQVGSGSLWLHFGGRFNFLRLAEIYSAVPSVTGISCPLPERVRGGPGVLPWLKGYSAK